MIIKKISGVEIEPIELKMRIASKVDIDVLVQFEKDVAAQLSRDGLWGFYAPEQYKEFLDKGSVVQMYYDGDELVAFLSVWLNSKKELDKHGEGFDFKKTAIYGGVMVEPSYWGNGLQKQMGIEIESIAKAAGCNVIVATVSPKNEWSYNNLIQSGYKAVEKKMMSKGERYIVIKNI